MSVDYHVAIDQANWPTVAMVNECLSEYTPLLRLTGGAPDQPLADVENTLGLAVEFERKKFELEASIVQLSPTQSYAYQPDTGSEADEIGGVKLPEGVKVYSAGDFKPADINADLASIGADDVHFKDGDYVLSLSFRSDAREWRAGSMLMGAMIKCFDGYGFEMQAGSHGREAFADELIKAAKKKSLWK